MSMSVYAVGGIGIIFTPAKLDEAAQEVLSDGLNGLPDGLICEEIGAYQETPTFFLGAGRAVGWNAGVDLSPMTLLNVDAIRKLILDHLATVPIGDGNAVSLFREEGFGLYIFPYVN